jgi:glycosyltransferase involved in cell wall biosynthesis
MPGQVTGLPLAELYSHAGLFVLPSYHEGMPIVLLEALGYGLSVLASDIPANHQAGLAAERFFPAGDIETAAAKIRQYAAKVLAPDERAQQISAIAHNFDWTLIAERTLAVYAKVLHTPPLGRQWLLWRPWRPRPPWRH